MVLDEKDVFFKSLFQFKINLMTSLLPVVVDTYLVTIDLAFISSGTHCCGYWHLLRYYTYHQY